MHERLLAAGVPDGVVGRAGHPVDRLGGLVGGAASWHGVLLLGLGEGARGGAGRGGRCRPGTGVVTLPGGAGRASSDDVRADRAEMTDEGVGAVP
ncbi:hypothetical protein GCM10027270_08570 [Nocardioides ginkgobilobae]